jgi:hypothetical protein
MATHHAEGGASHSLMPRNLRFHADVGCDRAHTASNEIATARQPAVARNHTQGCGAPGARDVTSGRSRHIAHRRPQFGRGQIGGWLQISASEIATADTNAATASVKSCSSSGILFNGSFRMAHLHVRVQRAKADAVPRFVIELSWCAWL